MSGYYLLKNGEYAYNKSYSVGYDFGSIKRLERYPMGALSTLYICFTLKKYNSDYIKTYFDSLKWYKEIYMISAEGARNHGLLNVPTDDFFDTYHYITEDTDEQFKIAKVIELLEQKIQKQQELVECLKKYKRGFAKQIFDELTQQYPLREMDEIFSFIRNGFVGTVTPYFTDKDNGVQYLQGTNIHSGKITDDTVFYVSRDFNDKHRKNILKPDDILVVQSGHVGECAVVGEEYAGANCHALIIMSNAGNCCSNYVAQYLNSDIGVQKIAAITTGNTIKHILATTISKVTIPVPSLEKQKKVATVLTLIDKHIDFENEILMQLMSSRQGLLQHLFI